MLQKIIVAKGAVAFPLPNQKESTRLLFKASIVLIIALYFLLKPALSMAQIDINEFPPGHPNVTVSAIDQLKGFPTPRYKAGHTLLPNFNWMDPVYFGGRFQPGVTETQAVANSVNIQTELAKSYNYMIVLGGELNYHNAWVTLANQNPQWKVSMITFRAHNNTLLWQGTLPNDHYLQNSSGQFIDPNGNVTGAKYWRPTAPTSSYISDGLAVKNNFNVVLANLTRNMDFINENGEVFSLYPNSVMSMDPVVTSAKNASGLSWENYLGLKVKDNTVQAYRDQFMTLPKLQNAHFSEYRIDGQRDWNFRYEQTRYINKPINGKYYSTSDFYPRWPSNWKDWTGPWHGLKWMTESRHYEIAAGDKLYSPFVAAGWDANPELDMRPAQWLGLLKLLSIYGAEFFYTGYFNDQGSYAPPNPPPHDAKGYAWQAAIPSYAQAVTSRYEDILRNGSLLAGDMINTSATPDIPYYQFNTGATNKVVSVRKKDSANIYVITGTIQNSSNVINSTPLTADAAITLNGQNLQFKIRRQGNTYIYDNTVTSAPVFYQLDEWHEASHPYRWTKDFNLEAELFDITSASVAIKTKVPVGTPAADFRNAFSYVSFSAVSDLTYNFQPRGTVPVNYYLWIRARSKDLTSTGFTVLLDGANAQQFSCITDSNWVWYRYNTSNQAVTFNNLSLVAHTLKISPANVKLEIDKIAIVTSSSAVYGTQASPCAGGGATITPGGPTTFCQGGNVALAANSGTAYLWSNGSTLQSITASTSASYTVVVTNGGVPSTSSPMPVTVNSLPSASISAGGATTFCQGGSVVLTSGSGSAYLWLPGNQTSSSITVTASGSYTVRVTNSYGCSATSSPVNVTVNNCSGCPIPTPLTTSYITASSANLQWGAVTGVDSLQVRIKNMTTGYVYITGMFRGWLADITVGNGASTTYRWRIRSKCGSTVTAWSSYLAYTTPSARYAGEQEGDLSEALTLYEGNDDMEEDGDALKVEDSAVEATDFTIYPNPASDETMMSFQSVTIGVATIQLLDFTGKMISDNKVRVSEGLNNHSIDLRKYPKGIYLLMLHLNGTTNSKKFVVQ